MSPLVPPRRLDAATVAAIVEGRHGEPFAVLGPHPVAEGVVVRAFAPGAERLEVLALDGALLGELAPLHPAGLFEGLFDRRSFPRAYRLRAHRGAWSWELEDAYRFAPVFDEAELARLWEENGRPWLRLGAHLRVHEGASGVVFALWAPRAARVAVVGDFNGWDPRTHAMRRRAHGVWELFVPGATRGGRYRFAIRDERGRALPLRPDPFATLCDASGAAVVRAPAPPGGDDAPRLGPHAFECASERPLAFLELGFETWLDRRAGGPRARALPALARELGFTHLALRAPRQPAGAPAAVGFPAGPFAPLAAEEALEGLRRLVDAAHDASLGVVLDWPLLKTNPAELGLAVFDGTPLFETEAGGDWDVARAEVESFLLASACFWLEAFRLDGLRSAVPSPPRWARPAEGACEALSAFPRRLAERLAQRFPGVVTIAEETDLPSGLTRPSWQGGHGFALAENGAFARALFAFFASDFALRGREGCALAFARAHAFAERFLLPLRLEDAAFGASPIERLPGEPVRRWA
ncbi:MAG: hypothetical protein N2038_08810, partial [Geminicoccaceae bacterium]|nr:hypothetical protein [Geminicoccaceae bacterium]